VGLSPTTVATAPFLEAKPRRKARPLGRDEHGDRAGEQERIDPAHSSAIVPGRDPVQSGAGTGSRLTLVLAALALGAPATAAAAGDTLVLRSKAITLKPYEVVQGAVAVP
jgi:hypothetical protein